MKRVRMERVERAERAERAKLAERAELQVRQWPAEPATAELWINLHAPRRGAATATNACFRNVYGRGVCPTGRVGGRATLSGSSRTPIVPSCSGSSCCRGQHVPRADILIYLGGGAGNADYGI